MTDKQLKKLSRKIDPATIVTLLVTEMEDQGVAVNEHNLARVYVRVLGKIPDVAQSQVEDMLAEKQLRSSW